MNATATINRILSYSDSSSETLIFDMVYSFWAMAAFEDTKRQWEETIAYIKGFHDMAFLAGNSDMVQHAAMLRGVAIYRAANSNY